MTTIGASIGRRQGLSSGTRRFTDNYGEAATWARYKEGKGTTIGNAGEYLVVGELLRRGAITALAPGNTPGFNILVTNGIDSMNVRVKT